MKFRNLVRSLHGTIGLIMGLLFAIVSLTGSSIIFRQEIDRSLNRSLHTVVAQTTTMPLENLLVPVRENYPDLPIEYISFPQQPDRSYTIVMTDKNGHRLETFVNPYTGKILGERMTDLAISYLNLADLNDCLDLTASRGWAREREKWRFLLAHGQGVRSPR